MGPYIEELPPLPGDTEPWYGVHEGESYWQMSESVLCGLCEIDEWAEEGE